MDIVEARGPGVRAAKALDVGVDPARSGVRRVLHATEVEPGIPDGHIPDSSFVLVARADS
ncbi:hypothetical protein ACIGXM_11840 [Kitasatospora sp. NPDC052896]|uniref:hypothetical protein n=1 Tax=Kitasatospora sp. NPDC052896 TaxID=3364061 RepID=UPI0037C90EF4